MISKLLSSLLAGLQTPVTHKTGGAPKQTCDYVLHKRAQNSRYENGIPRIPFGLAY